LTSYAFMSAGSSRSRVAYTMTRASTKKGAAGMSRFLPELRLRSSKELFEAVDQSQKSLGTKSRIIAEKLMVAVSARAYGWRCKLLIRMPFDNAWLRSLLFL
jgi:hypothetical protein